ncbi:response regulator [Rubrolithibacter danxiaensis]|uniref:response regulator n=1 Tax=Rubrolithibacter danxiaensis TaxID=3390805 RepID=UPI003BF806F2
MVNILLVEDDQLDIINVERTLKKINLPVRLNITKNGQEALALLKSDLSESLPDVILLDINMPKMNGLDFLKAIRQDEHLKRISVFILTTSSEPADKETFQQLGITGYIIKPLILSGSNKSKDSLNLLIDLLNVSQFNSRI